MSDDFSFADFPLPLSESITLALDVTEVTDRCVHCYNRYERTRERIRWLTMWRDEVKHTQKELSDEHTHDPRYNKTFKDLYDQLVTTLAILQKEHCPHCAARLAGTPKVELKLQPW
jgi:hypothetical protein